MLQVLYQALEVVELFWEECVSVLYIKLLLPFSDTSPFSQRFLFLYAFSFIGSRVLSYVSASILFLHIICTDELTRTIQ